MLNMTLFMGLHRAQPLRPVANVMHRFGELATLISAMLVDGVSATTFLYSVGTIHHTRLSPITGLWLEAIIQMI